VDKENLTLSLRFPRPLKADRNRVNRHRWQIDPPPSLLPINVP